MTYSNLKKTVASLVVLPAVFASAQLHANCATAERPTIPASVTNAEEMLSVKQAVESYMAVSNEYLECQKRTKKRNDMIDEMELVAADYNVLIMLYKEQQG